MAKTLIRKIPRPSGTHTRRIFPARKRRERTQKAPPFPATPQSAYSTVRRPKRRTAPGARAMRDTDNQTARQSTTSEQPEQGARGSDPARGFHSAGKSSLRHEASPAVVHAEVWRAWFLRDQDRLSDVSRDDIYTRGERTPPSCVLDVAGSRRSFDLARDVRGFRQDLQQEGPWDLVGNNPVFFIQARQIPDLAIR